ncbi:MAG: DNA repair protein RadC [Candidatus Marinimicrobia bacterium]|nr:DNA repair protein RadC [Candidatus Neomarinimicrobiota bacterium]MBT7376574.1 DNA repair protein RadC [Candidatus Neomarinimicrobiota bacterium]
MPKSQGHYANLRQRFLQNDIDGFLDYEVIELLLKLADNRRDQKSTAKQLIEEFQSLKGVLEASPIQLEKVVGVGPANIFGIKLVHSVSRRYLKNQILNKEVISSSIDIKNYLIHSLRDKSRENFGLILLNGRNEILDFVIIFEGTLTSSAVYPREVIKLVLERDAAAIILVHNHPSGNPNPSKEDISITKRLIDGCKLIDVHVHDHLIIAGNEITSLADKGLM